MDPKETGVSEDMDPKETGASEDMGVPRVGCIVGELVGPSRTSCQTVTLPSSCRLAYSMDRGMSSRELPKAIMLPLLVIANDLDDSTDSPSGTCMICPMVNPVSTLYT